MATKGKAWGGRFQEATDALAEAMNASVAFDARLGLEDIAGSIAHARMLEAQQILAPAERQAIEEALSVIANEIRAGDFEFTEAREDVHMNVEGALKDRIGEVAGRLHTGRSRNDQVALDLRLWLRRALTETTRGLGAVVDVLLQLAETHAAVPMPGYTHLQRAQPITFGHHLMAYAAMFLRDMERCLDARKRAAVMPLGSGALAGTPLPLNRNHVAQTLAMPTLTLNSLDAVSDRDPALESLATLSILMVHASRLGEELILWCSQEFGFIELSDAFCTGSSLMPQKKNPDIPELLRGKSGRVFGDLMSLLTVMKGLPLAYNKDMQEDKEPIFDAFDTVFQCVGILPDLLATMRVRPKRMMHALEAGFLLATDLADHLVSAGVPFREAHEIVGKVVALCVKEGLRLEDLDESQLQDIHPALDNQALASLDVQKSLDRRDIPGAPNPSRVREAISQARLMLGEYLEKASVNGPSALEEALYAGAELP